MTEHEQEITDLRAENAELRRVLAERGRHERDCYHGLSGTTCACIIGRLGKVAE